jgi:hypothetical protein
MASVPRSLNFQLMYALNISTLARLRVPMPWRASGNAEAPTVERMTSMPLLRSRRRRATGSMEIASLSQLTTSPTLVRCPRRCDSTLLSRTNISLTCVRRRSIS